LIDVKTRDASSLGGGLGEIVASVIRAAESRAIRSTLELTKGNKSRAAELLKVSYKTLLTKIKVYGIH